MHLRYKGPMVVIARSAGGAYILAELDGTVLRDKVGAFRVLPHWARYEPIELPENIHELIDLSKKQLEKMVEDDSEELQRNDDEDFAFNRMPKSKRNDESNEESDAGSEAD